jgi:2'-5' RNA ligase
MSALVVPVPEAELLVSGLRARFDPTSALGVPAHITILVPFISPGAITEFDVSKLRAIFGNLAAFPFGFNGIGRWPRTAFLKLAAVDPFVRLTQAVTTAFPAYQPYGGRHAEIVPHLTVADGDELNACEAEIELNSGLASAAPIASICRRVELIENSARFWRTMHVFPLAAT